MACMLAWYSVDARVALRQHRRRTWLVSLSHLIDAAKRVYGLELGDTDASARRSASSLFRISVAVSRPGPSHALLRPR